jgi:hypothetical protein
MAEGLKMALPGPKSLVRFSGVMPTFIEKSEGEGLTQSGPSAPQDREIVD